MKVQYMNYLFSHLDIILSSLEFIKNVKDL